MAKLHLVDDDPDIRHILSFVFGEEGHEVRVSTDGKQALEAMLMDPPDLLILDLMMPQMDGLSVLRNMKDHQILESTKVLVLTAKGSEHDRHLALDLGADDYLTKPFRPDGVIEAVEMMLESSKEDLRVRREQERDTAHLLSQLESILDD